MSARRTRKTSRRTKALPENYEQGASNALLFCSNEERENLPRGKHTCPLDCTCWAL
jgi:hypothetical protein